MGIPLKRVPRYQRDPDHELALLRVADERGRVWLKNLQRVLLAILMVIAAGTAVMTFLNGHLPLAKNFMTFYSFCALYLPRNRNYLEKQ